MENNYNYNKMSEFTFSKSKEIDRTKIILFVPESFAICNNILNSKLLGTFDNVLKGISTEYKLDHILERIYTYFKYTYLERDEDIVRRECLKSFGLNLSDIKSLIMFDNYLKELLGLPYDSMDMWYNQVEKKETIDKILKSLMGEIKSSDSHMLDVIMGKIEPSYRIEVMENTIYVILLEGFSNLLMSRDLVFRRMLFTDILREYQRKFGSDLLYKSDLFNVFMLKLDNNLSIAN